jgi:hypothetical protein
LDRQIPPKTIYHGKTKIVIHSPLVVMTKEEKQKWFEEELEKGNPTLLEIMEAAWRCLE